MEEENIEKLLHQNKELTIHNHKLSCVLKLYMVNTYSMVEKLEISERFDMVDTIEEVDSLYQEYVKK